MHKEFEIIDDEVIITNELGHKQQREISDNIEEILITENNIEEIESLMNYENNIQKKCKKAINKYFGYYGVLGGLQLLNAMLNIISSDFSLAIIWAIAASGNFGWVERKTLLLGHFYRNGLEII